MEVYGQEKLEQPGRGELERLFEGEIKESDKKAILQELDKQLDKVSPPLPGQPSLAERTNQRGIMRDFAISCLQLRADAIAQAIEREDMALAAEIQSKMAEIKA